MIKNMILASFLALGLTACGDNSSSNEPTTNTPDLNTSEDETLECSVNGSVVLGVEGKSCTHESNTLTCTNGAANLNGGLTAGSGTITINGTSYTCP